MTSIMVTPRTYRNSFARVVRRDDDWYQRAAHRLARMICRYIFMAWADARAEVVYDPARREFQVHISFYAAFIPGVEPGAELQIKDAIEPPGLPIEMLKFFKEQGA